MVYNAKYEGLVFIAIKELGLASVDEIQEFVTEHLKTTIELATIKLYAERWRARDAVVVDFMDGVRRYKIAKVPPPFKSLKMDNIKNLRNKDWKEALKQIDQEYPMPSDAITQPKGKVGGHVKVTITLEAVDPILGGIPMDGSNKLHLHRDVDGEPIITPAMFKGWVRENSRMVGWNPNAHSWIGFGVGKVAKGYKLIEVQAPVVAQNRGKGMQKYEALDRGATISTTWRVPLRGQGIKNVGHVKELFEATLETPVKGLGANARFLGGRVKLIDLKET